VPSFASIERAHLVEALRAAGPDAPTLCEGWTARDLAAHLVARERRADSGPGLLLGPFGGWTERVRRGYATKDWAELVRLVETGPPLLSAFSLPGADAAANLSEHFVHCEDVRRAAPGWRPRELAPGLQDALWTMLTQRGSVMFRKSRVGVVVATPDGRRATLVDREPAVTLTGDPAELVLYAFGRTEHAMVTVDGADDAVRRFAGTPLGA
jgi:uncharacterized protein (TIGR03085 family)